MTERSKESGSRRGMERKNNMKNRPQALPEERENVWCRKKTRTQGSGD